MKIKKGVSLLGTKVELLIGLIVAESVYHQHGSRLRVTSLVDGHHSRNSLHYAGYAADLGIRDVPRHQIEPIVLDLKESLGEEFDVVLEANHIHIEYQPEKGVNL